jgi:hypothetical protein
MARALSVARAQVSPANQPAYLLALGELAGRLRERGESLWLFRHPTRPDTFLEFTESATPEQHRSRARRDREEAELEQRVRSLATYAPDAGELWEEIPLGKQ